MVIFNYKANMIQIILL